VAPVTGFVLAGGKSSRMGADKVFLQFRGKVLLRCALEKAARVAEEVYIVGDPAKFQPFGRVVKDVFPESGPLGGIHAALRHTKSDLNLMLAVDIPLVEDEFLQYLISTAGKSNALVTVPRAGGGFQPLCAVYRREFGDVAERALREGRNKIEPLFDLVETRVLEEKALANLGFSAGMFRNLNTPEEFAQAQKDTGRKEHMVPASVQVPREDENLSAMTEKTPPYIDFKDVSKSFGDHHVLEHVNFEVMPGETVCILGRSGVGKSVALQHIMGFLKPDSGRVIVAFEDITDFTEEQLEGIRKKVTMVFQNGALFDSLTVGENVAFPLRERQNMTEEQIYQVVDGLLEMVGVKEMRDLLPSDLSTGMKRSVAIARALAARPECVLYDEPTTMVDPLMAQLLGDLIKRLKIQLHLTSVVVTHDMRLAKKVADRVVFLHEAKVLFFGTYPEMEKCQEPIVQEFLKLDELIAEPC
jgi:phospholipid/cholesterol/gamma-HCH transport system ATP-binding protein